jgi:copper transport protein
VRRAGTLAALTLAALALPGVAAAHATLTKSSPPAQSNVAAPPTEIVLVFDQPVTVTSRSIQVLTKDGTSYAGTATTRKGGRVVVAPVSRLLAGSAYTVRWRVTSADGHSPAGVFTFGIGVKAPPPTEAVGAAGTTWKDDVARWLLLGALALVIGPLAVRLLVLRGADVQSSLEQRIHLLTSAGAFLVIDVGIVAFVLRASNALQLPFGDLFYGDLKPFAEKTNFGIAFLVMTFGFGVIAAFLLVAWIFDWYALRWPALLGSLALASGLSLAGHQATEPNSTRLTELADWVHLVAACVWVGGLVTLALCVWPAAPALRRAAFLGFARLAVALVAAMAIAGVYLALDRLPELSDLWTTTYGQILLVKSALVALAFAWGGVHHFFVRPRLEAGENPRVRPSLVGEMGVALAVLLVAAALTNAAPPPVPTSVQPQARSTR